MCDEPVRTWVDGTPFQEWMIRAGGKAGAPVNAVEFRGAPAASVTPEVAAAIREARAVIVGPSNPLISIGPILAVPGMLQALTETAAPVVAVSPLVSGGAVKGPTEDFMAYAGHPLSSDGIAAVYDGLIDGLVADEAAGELPTAVTDVLMADAEARTRVAREALEFALLLGS
jgi:LPPG:FO 2-phospho-L-lactate transferase